MSNAHVFLTGVTGFVGKAVLEKLMRQREALGIERVSVLVRARSKSDGKPVDAEARFRADVAASEMFKNLPAGWTSAIEVLAGDLEKPDCGLDPQARDAVVPNVTHIIHCAASMDFELSLQPATTANVTLAAHVLELARDCPRLHRMVHVSTAYVTPWKSGPLDERLPHMPRDPEIAYQDIVTGRIRDEAAMMAEARHPNTHTFTKCLAEHILIRRRGHVPLSIVRPSVLSTAWKQPFPGWIDSDQAFAGCLLLIGLGLVHTWQADPSTRLDVLPVDVLADRLVDTALDPEPTPAGTTPIRYAVLGPERALRIDLIVDRTTRFFGERPGAETPPHMFIGKQEHGFRFADFFRRAVPTQVKRLLLLATFRNADRKRLEKLDTYLRFLNWVFAYFTHHTFDFRPSKPIELPGFSPQGYIELINRGIYKHLLRLDEHEATLAGAAHDDARADLNWMLEKPRGNWVVRTLGYGLRKTLRRCTTRVTFDRPSFERAAAVAPPEALYVLAPSHRSYFDFLLMSYLCFQHPELGIPVPHIAAAEEFSRIPLVGKLLRQSHAFYIKRGVGSAAPELGEELRRIASRDAALMFFIEGQRSRARQFLMPKRGLLRGLQATGRSFAILPIGLTYDRLPEEGAFEQELSGLKKPKMSLRGILKWLAQLVRDKVQLGRVHIACGEPKLMTPTTDVHEVAATILAEQQRHTAATGFHLRTFLSEGLLPGVDEEWLTQAIRKRGGLVLDSDLPVPQGASPALLQSLRNQWMNWFFPEALAFYPDNLVIRDYVEHHLWLQAPPAQDIEDPRVRTVVDALFGPIVGDTVLAARQLGIPGQPLVHPDPKSLVRAFPSTHLPQAEDAYRLLAARGILAEPKPGEYAWGPNADDLPDFIAACVKQAPPWQEIETPSKAPDSPRTI